MSWSDPCTNCGNHRADCDCGDYCFYKRNAWLEDVKKEQKHYPLFRGRELDPEQLIELYNMGKTPIDALNDLSTLA